MANSVQRQRRISFWIECALGALFFLGMIAAYGLADRLARGSL